MFPWSRPPFVRRSVLVNLTDDKTAFRGVLWDVCGPWLLLRSAYIHQDGKQPAAVDGEVVIHRDRVQFTQLLHD